VQFAAKTELALTIIKAALADGVPVAPVTGDAAYGDSGTFRSELRRLDMEYFLQTDGNSLKAWSDSVQLEHKRIRWQISDQQPAAQTLRELAGKLTAQAWHPVQWKAANGSTRQTRAAWQKVCLVSDLDLQNGESPACWMVVDWPEDRDEPYHRYVAHLKHDPIAALCLQLSRGRWPIERYFQRSKDELGLDHYEGRSWRGFHHHLALSAVAYLFILSLCLRNKKNFWFNVGASAPPDPAVDHEINRILSFLLHKV
jgi:SRSO17 transposase